MSQSSAPAIAELLFNALSHLRWTELNCDQFVGRLACSDFVDICWLSRLLSVAQKDRGLLTPSGNDAISKIVLSKYRLLDAWPKRNLKVTQQWLGERLFFARANTLSTITSGKLSTIVCSRLGRDKQRLTHWPALLDWAIRKVSSENGILLTIAGTTLFESSVQFARAARLTTVELVLSEQAQNVRRPIDVSKWLATCLENAALTGIENRPPRCADELQVLMSPEIKASQGAHETDPSDFLEAPLQDRASIALANKVLAVSITAGGKVASLIQQRLESPDFSSASVFVAIPQFVGTANQDSANENVEWLDRGAVGYVVMIDNSQQLAECCRCRIPSRDTTLQICCSLEHWLAKDQSNWHYLTHCTRGSIGPVPQESMAGYYRRIWAEGRVHATDPFFALQSIIADGRVRGSTWLTRGDQPTVSLSQVPLPELLSRRKFRKHLGRWEWEPYGLLFDQRVLTQAQPVIYANHNELSSMTGDQQALFQPIDSNIDWTAEQEWRVLGDIDLRTLPAEAATVFTRYRHEAMQLAAVSRFPVVWCVE
jgi:hypothetical protein